MSSCTSVSLLNAVMLSLGGSRSSKFCSISGLRKLREIAGAAPLEIANFSCRI